MTSLILTEMIVDCVSMFALYILKNRIQLGEFI